MQTLVRPTPSRAVLGSLLLATAGCVVDKPTGDGSGDTGTSADSVTDSGVDTDTGGGCSTPLSSEELVLDQVDLAFTSTWTNGPCPGDTRFDEALTQWDYLSPDVSYADYYPAQFVAWGEVEWYGRRVWKVQFTAVECTTPGSVYGTEIEVRYLVCADDGVRLAGVEYSYTDPSNDGYTVELFDPPPLLLPEDRTEGTVWSEEFDYTAFYYDARLYPDDEGYRSATHTLTGTMGELASTDVAAGTYNAQALVVGGLPDPHSGTVRSDEETRWAEGEGLIRLSSASFFVLDTYELVRSGAP